MYVCMYVCTVCMYVSMYDVLKRCYEPIRISIWSSCDTLTDQMGKQEKWIIKLWTAGGTFVWPDLTWAVLNCVPSKWSLWKAIRSDTRNPDPALTGTLKGYSLAYSSVYGDRCRSGLLRENTLHTRVSLYRWCGRVGANTFRKWNGCGSGCGDHQPFRWATSNRLGL